MREALKLMGVDVTTLQQIINVFNKITLLDNVRIALRTPDQVGIYTVYAITNNDNYNTGFGMGALVVKKHYSGVKLDWNQDFTNGKISAADVKNFDFGATLSYNGEQVEDQSLCTTCTPASPAGGSRTPAPRHPRLSPAAML